MKKIITIFYFLIPLSISAQTCEQILADAQNAAKKGLYRDAVLKYLAAQKVCPTTRDQEIKGYVLDVFNKIDALKSKAEKAEIAAKNALKQAETDRAKAEKAEKDVKDALNQAEVNLQKAKDEEAKAIAEQAKTQKALDEAKAANERVVASYLRDIDQHILKLEYDYAFEKCQTALALNVENQKADIAKYVLEIAYFYTESDTFQAAIKTLNLLNINVLSNRTDLLEAIQKNAPPQYFAFLEDRYYPKMIDVEGGTFIMKDDSLAYEVRLNSYKMAETETTVWQYFLYLKAKRKKPSETPPWQYWGNNPMVNTTWYNAVGYCNWVSARQKRERVYTIDIIDRNYTTANWQAKGYRLPTEAEWEYAARGGKYNSPFKFSGSDIIDSVAWYLPNSSSRTQPVKRLKANALGLYDMSGNVKERCFDWDTESERYNISSTNNPHGAEDGIYLRRIVRGGSWNDSGYPCIVSARSGYYPEVTGDNYGFRCVRYD
jgi:formylglycine-generating enzyme